MFDLVYLPWLLLAGAVALYWWQSGVYKGRARELASLRILGFSRGEVGYILVGETMLLALLAQPVGWWLGWRFAKFMTDGFESDLYAIPLILEPATYANASLIVLVAAFVSVLLVHRRLREMDLVSVMKTRE